MEIQAEGPRLSLAWPLFNFSPWTRLMDSPSVPRWIHIPQCMPVIQLQHLFGVKKKKKKEKQPAAVFSWSVEVWQTVHYWLESLHPNQNKNKLWLIRRCCVSEILNDSLGFCCEERHITIAIGSTLTFKLNLAIRAAPPQHPWDVKRLTVLTPDPIS